MADVQLHDKRFRTKINRVEIEQRIAALGEQVNADYAGKKPVFLVVLNGAFMFAGQLLKEVPTDAEIQFVRLASYEGTTSTGDVRTLMGVSGSLKDRNVIIVEDIVDTGNTLKKLDEILRDHSVASIRVATLLFKPDAYTGGRSVDYVGFSIPNEFVVGYGLDYDGLGRNLPHIYVINE